MPRLPRSLVRLVVAALLALSLLPASRAHAQPRTPTRVAVLTFGPGDHPFFKFGHNAILLEDPSGEGLVFNWGTFNFDSMLIPKFLRGRMKYWLSISEGPQTLVHYKDENRTVEIQWLDLEEAQRAALAQLLFENYRPQNREYLYDYFWDNCSTRVRDAVDNVVGGLVRQAGAVPASQSQRAHALRLTSDFVPLYLGLAFGLGSHTDKPITLWDEAFLPERMRDLLEKVTLPSGKPLVKSHEVWFRAARADMPARPPSWVPWFAIVGVLLGSLLAGLGWLARRWPAARVALGGLASLIGFVAGLLGLILLLLWLFTDHRVAHANENILQAAPWALSLLVYGIGVARGRALALRRGTVVAAAAAGASLLGLLLKVLPWFFQSNYSFIVLFLPVWTGMAVGLWLILKAQRQAAAAAA